MGRKHEDMWRVKGEGDGKKQEDMCRVKYGGIRIKWKGGWGRIGGWKTGRGASWEENGRNGMEKGGNGEKDMRQGKGRRREILEDGMRT